LLRRSDFETSDIGFGHVAVINDSIAVEVVSRTDPATLEVSKPRASSLQDKIPPGDSEDSAVAIVSFSRLIEQVRAWTLGALGIEDESTITDPGPVSLLIALRTVARAYANAAAMDLPTLPGTTVTTAARTLRKTAQPPSSL
jgi:hypothetical protein